MTRIERLCYYIVSNSSFRVTQLMAHVCNTSCEKATNALMVWEHLQLIFTFPPAFRLATRRCSACVLATNRHGSCRPLNCRKRSTCYCAFFFVISIYCFLCSSKSPVSVWVRAYLSKMHRDQTANCAAALPSASQCHLFEESTLSKR